MLIHSDDDIHICDSIYRVITMTMDIDEDTVIDDAVTNFHVAASDAVGNDSAVYDSSVF